MILDEINQMARKISELNATSIHDLHAKSLFLLEYMTDDAGDLICNIAMSMCKDIKTLAGGNQKSQRT